MSNRFKRNKSIHIAKSQGENTKIIIQLQKELGEAIAHAEIQRKLVYMLVHQHNGRIEIDEDDYRMALQVPPLESIVRLDHDKDAKKVVLSECDEHGEPTSLIIT